MLRAPLILLLSSAIFGATAASVFAQPTGRLTGVVRDSSGGVLPGATVSVTGAPADQSSTLAHRSRGTLCNRYAAAGALHGGGDARRVSIEAQEISTDGRPATLDILLEISSRLETVSVTATKTGASDITVNTDCDYGAFRAGDRATRRAKHCRPSRRRAHAYRLTTHRARAGHDPRNRYQSDFRGIGSEFHDSSRRRVSGTTVDGIRRFSRPRARRSSARPAGDFVGRNSVGGTINLITRQPANALEMTARLTAGSYDKLRAEGAVSGPLVKIGSWRASLSSAARVGSCAISITRTTHSAVRTPGRGEDKCASSLDPGASC